MDRAREEEDDVGERREEEARAAGESRRGEVKGGGWIARQVEEGEDGIRGERRGPGLEEEAMGVDGRRGRGRVKEGGGGARFDDEEEEEGARAGLEEFEKSCRESSPISPSIVGREKRGGSPEKRLTERSFWLGGEGERGGCGEVRRFRR